MSEERRGRFVEAGNRRVVETTRGLMPESALERKVGVDENDNARVEWEEYWFNGELVKRSAHATVKKMPALLSAAGGFK